MVNCKNPEFIINSGFFICFEIIFYNNEEIIHLKNTIDFSKKIILVTGHRRENHGLGIQNICEALLELATKYNNEA